MFTFPDYMGKTTGDVADFLNGFAVNLPKFASELNIDPAQLQYIKDGAALYNWLENTNTVESRNASKASTDARDMFAGDVMPSDFVPTTAQFTPPPVTKTPIEDGFVGYINELVKQIRLTKAYKTNPSIASTLKIAPVSVPNAPPDKASIASIEGLPDFAMQVKANKYRAKSILFYDMKDPANPLFLSAQSSAVFVDDRPPTVAGQSEIRSYAIRYGDAQNKPLAGSLMSDIVSLPTHP